MVAVDKSQKRRPVPVYVRTERGAISQKICRHPYRRTFTHMKYNSHPSQIALTDVVIFVACVELVAQGEGAVPLELLGKFDGAVRRVRAITFPTLEALADVAGPVALIVHHIKNVLLHPMVGDGLIVVRTVDVQVVIDVHLDGVAITPQAERKKETQVVRTFCEGSLARG